MSAPVIVVVVFAAWFGLAAVGTVLWIVAVELSAYRALARRAAQANRSLARKTDR